MRSDLSRVADGLRCRRWDGAIQEADLAEDLMVDRETLGCVKSVYLGDTLDGDGGADLAACCCFPSQVLRPMEGMGLLQFLDLFTAISTAGDWSCWNNLMCLICILDNSEYYGLIF